MWQQVVGHDRVVERFRRAAGRGRLASTYLFSGPRGIGKRTFAVRLAQALLCQNDRGNLEICHACDSCRQMEAGSHPDFEYIAKPPGKSDLPVELFLGDKDHRMREGLCHRISLKPMMGGRKVAVIDDADDLNVASANCLLKTLEEPPPHSILILIGTSAARQLPTIRSRAQVVSFSPLPADELAELILSQELVADRESAVRLAADSGGSIDRTADLAKPETADFRQQLRRELASVRLDAVRLGELIGGFIEAAGTQAADRRVRFRRTVEFAAEFYRQQIRIACGIEAEQNGAPLDVESATECLDRCLAACQQIDRNANQSTLLACWLDDLARLSRGERVLPIT
ncbi:MAG: DNA polymerase III subunit [Pirellulales bacterium]